MEEPLPRADPAQAERLHRFAHDLRNRLAAIREVLRHLAGPPDGLDHGELGLFGEQQYFKAMRQVEELLDDLGVDRTPRLTGAAPLDLGAMVRRAVEGMTHRVVRKEQPVDMHLMEGLYTVGDARQLEEIVSALVSNASKFSPRGSTIGVDLRREGQEAVIAVSDRGIGLDAEDLEAVFVRYAWTSGRSTEGEAQGRSSLARARQWARVHGGELSAQSAGPGAGAVFSLRLPLADQAS